jgi:hypothetical protein
MAVLLACLLAITACGNGNVVAAGGQEESVAEVDSVSIDVEAQLAGVEIVDHTGEEEHIDNDALPNIGVDSGAVWTDSSNPEPVPESATSVSEPDPEPESVISEPEPEPEPEYQNPGTHGGYLHEVGGARFYTEHDINQWLKPDERYPEYFDFDIYQMLVDIWCEDGGNILGTSDGYVRFNEGHTQEAIWFETIDTANSRLFHKARIQSNDQNGIEIISVEMYDCPGPYGVDYYSILDGYSHLLHKELAELILYAAEQIVAESPYESISSLNLGQNFSVVY